MAWQQQRRHSPVPEPRHDILERSPSVRVTVPTPAASCFVMARMLASWRRNSITRSRLKILFGLPRGRFFPDLL
jgi:hypothetical protein